MNNKYIISKLKCHKDRSKPQKRYTKERTLLIYRMNQRLERIKDQNVTKYGCKDTKKTSIIKR